MTDDLFGQPDTYLERETFGLVKSIGWDILEYEPGRYLSLLDGRLNNDSDHAQIGFLGKHESNGIAFTIDSFNFGTVTIGFRPKLYSFNDNFYTYTRGEDESYVMRYNLMVDSTSTFFSLGGSEYYRNFHDLCVLDENEVLVLREVRDENVSTSKGQIIWVLDGIIMRIIHLDYPDSFKYTWPERLTYNKNTESIFLMSLVSEENGSESFFQTLVQEYSITGEVLSSYVTPSHDFHTLPSQSFHIDEQVKYLYLFGNGATDLVGWVMKVEMATGAIVWKQVFTEPDFETGNKQCIPSHMQLDSDHESLILGGTFFSNDEIGNTVGFISKITLDGVIQWTRTFVISDGDSNEAQILSVRPASDGGYIAIGTSTFRNGASEIPFATLIVKTDENGLVKGYSTSTEELVTDSVSDLYSIFPNPVSEILTFRQNENANLTYRITDNMGKYYDLFTIKHDKEFHSLNVKNYPTGSYVRTVSDGVQLLNSELFVVD